MLLPALSSGCWLSYAFVPTYQYVLDKGDAKVITEWTLIQNSWKSIADGHGALLHIAESHKKAERASAMNGLVEIHQKLFRGWSIDLASGNGPGDLATLHSALLDNLASRAVDLSDPDLKATYLRIRPSEAKQLETWERIRKTTGVM